MKEKINVVVDTISKTSDEVVGAVGKVDKVVDPYRKSVFDRFPALFVLMVSFGVTTTFLGFERVLVSFTWINERPFIILAIGVTTLVLTGTLYKRLN